MDADMMHQAVTHNQDFTAVIKHVAVDLDMRGITISQHLQIKEPTFYQSWGEKRCTIYMVHINFSLQRISQSDPHRRRGRSGLLIRKIYF